jgi:Skp family chaperone for outer membrane proteins
MRPPKPSSRLLLGVLMTGLSAGFVATTLAQNKPKQPVAQRRALKVGVVDIGVLFRDYGRKDEMEKDINSKREKMKKEIELDGKKLVDGRRKLDKLGYREGSRPWMREAEKLKLAQYSLELKTKRLQEALKNEVEQQTLSILMELEQTIEDYGKRHGFDLILKIDKAERQRSADGELVAQFQERIFRAQISDVLYFNENELDITNSVKQRLNSAQNQERMKRLSEERRRTRAAPRRSNKPNKPSKPKGK